MLLRLALTAGLLIGTLAGCSLRDKPKLGPVATGAVQVQPLPPLPAESPIPAGTPYELDSGDRLRVSVFGEPNLSNSYTVDSSGFISMPLIGAVMARGVTTYELENRVAEEFRQNYVRDPKVTVQVEVYRPFFILGEVQRPGQYPYVNGMTVQMAVAIGGGFTERAKKRKVRITRRIDGLPVTMVVPPNAPVGPGDTVNVMERFF